MHLALDAVTWTESYLNGTEITFTKKVAVKELLSVDVTIWKNYKHTVNTQTMVQSGACSNYCFKDPLFLTV